MKSELEAYFAGHDRSRLIFEDICREMDRIGPTEIRVSKSQVAFWRNQAVARVWIPARYLHGNLAPLVLTLIFRYRDPSPRWKEIAEPAQGHFTHHLELYSPEDIDDEVIGWLRLAWEAAE